MENCKHCGTKLELKFSFSDPACPKCFWKVPDDRDEYTNIYGESYICQECGSNMKREDDGYMEELICSCGHSSDIDDYYDYIEGREYLTYEEACFEDGVEPTKNDDIFLNEGVD